MEIGRLTGKVGAVLIGIAILLWVSGQGWPWGWVCAGLGVLSWAVGLASGRLKVSE